VARERAGRDPEAMLIETFDHRDGVSSRVKLRMLVEFFVWLLTAPVSRQRP